MFDDQLMCCEVVFALGAVGLARVILSPLLDRTAVSHASSQFQVMDLVSLVWLLSLAMGTAKEIERRDHWGYPAPNNAPNSGLTLLLLSGCLLAVCCWWISVRALNRAGISSPLRRTVASSLVVPSGYFASALVCVGWPFWLSLVYWQSGLGLGTLCTALAVLLACYLGAKWVGRGAPS